MPAHRAAPAVLGLALVLTGCSGLESVLGEAPEPTRITAPPEDGPTLPATTTPSFTVVDSMFSQMMIPHHAQAVEMADLVPGRTDSPELLALAEEIRAAQRPEIDQMTAWLEEWGLETEIDLAEHAGHAGMEGMLSDEQLQAMVAAEGPEFDRLWLEGMIAHHEGAVSMAETALAAGVHRPTLELAEEILRAQEAEITRMRAMLGPSP